MSIFKGLSAFPITPADLDGHVNTSEFGLLVARLVAARVESIGLLGSTGTYMFLSREERRRAVEAAAEATGGEVPLIVGVGALRTNDAVAHAQDAERAGADGLLLAPVSYTPLMEDEVFHHFTAVAEATELPVCIYNNPGTTPFTFSVPLLERLAEHDRIAAVKMPLPTATDIAIDILHLRAALPEDFVVGYSGDWGCAEALLSGADSWFSVVAGTLPTATVALAQAALSRDAAETERLNAAFQPLWDLFQEYGSLRLVYAIANRLDLTQAQPPLPLRPLGSVALARLEDALSPLDVS